MSLWSRAQRRFHYNFNISSQITQSVDDAIEVGTLKGILCVSKLTPDQLRIRELERELAIAREERDILKVRYDRQTQSKAPLVTTIAQNFIK
mgnify:CR=1 FL=1